MPAKSFVGEAVELRHRLPKVWARLVGGDLVAWKARRIARATMGLSVEAVAYVDQHVAPVAHKIRVAGIDRTIATAIAAFMPEETERRRQAAADGRCFNVGKPESGLDGTADVWGTLDAADALDLDAAVAAGAEALKDLGSTESLDVRRSQAVAGLARRQLAFDLNRPDSEGDTMAPVGPGRCGSRARSCCTSTSPRPRSTAKAGSGGSRTTGPRSRPSRSASGAPTRMPRWW